MKKEHPHLPDSLQDPKLPVIHAQAPGNAMQQRRSDAPLPEIASSGKDPL